MKTLLVIALVCLIFAFATMLICIGVGMIIEALGLEDDVADWLRKRIKL